ncbi:hypothetical protein EXIGLDRAFT_431239 [Exidia glandulosa HHB12029]|uniref:Uncharacterized protein n=1 Tax=Exidia glandulosa HHB12029 TaxID=1314781 RepID=A0A165BAH7_EXIGL|nr:hypothetical protein EXIGLDRAFT_431239 [Exidia glandulosa HHB12029]
MEPPQPAARRFSAPPMSTHDLDEDDHYRTHRQDVLRLGPEITSTFHTVETILETADCSLYIVDDTLFMKLLPATFDVDVIVRTLSIPSTTPLRST